jgi:hypothetical protein
MKKIIWVDDSIDAMNVVVKNLFPKLWKLGISNEIIFVGDYYQEIEPNKGVITEDDIDEFHNLLFDKFDVFCDEQITDEMSNAQVWDKCKVIEPPRPHFIPTTDAERVADTIKKRMMDIVTPIDNDEVYVCSDIRIMRGDDLVATETVSMKLFYDFSNFKRDSDFFLKDIILYSTYYLDDDVLFKWKAKYKEFHKEHNKEIEIYPRELLTSSIDNDELKKFLNIFGS